MRTLLALVFSFGASSAAAQTPDPAATPAPVAVRSFAEGEAQGTEDAARGSVGPRWGTTGFAGGLFCTVPGCLGTTAYSAIDRPEIADRPGEPEFTRGYREAYLRTLRKRRAAWTFGGGTAGVLVGATAYLIWAYQQPETRNGDGDAFDFAAVGAVRF